MTSPTLPTNRILVTGALGWLGSRLVETLCHGLPDCPGLKTPQVELRVRCLVLPGQDPARLNAISKEMEILAGDLRDPEVSARFCADAKGALLFHTAGIIHPNRVSDLYATNVEGTRHLLDAAVRSGVQRAVVVSSNSPCGCNPHPDHLFDEQSPYRPYLNYGRSKMLMELEVKGRQAQGQIETVIVRPPWFYGPNQPARQTLFFRLIRDGKMPIVGSGNNLRSMGYVDNLCQGLLLAGAAACANGQTYWIADRSPYSMNQIVDTVERLLEREFGHRCAHKRLRLPALAGTAAFLADTALQALGRYHQKIHVLSEMHRTIACSIEKAQRELGYKPAVDLEEGMRRSLQWCLANGISI